MSKKASNLKEMETKEDIIEGKNEESSSMKRNDVEMNKVGIMRTFVESQDPTSKKIECLMSEKASNLKEMETKEDIIEGKNEESINMKSNDIEMNKVGIMRTFVESQDPTSKEVDDLMLRRFLRARDLDIEKASALFLKYLTWKRAFMPNGSISASEIPNELAQKKVFSQGFDKNGRPIKVIFGGRHIPSKEKGGLDEFKRFVVFTLEKLCARMPRGQEKFIFIGDLEGWGYANLNIRAYLGALSILQDYYPERLGKLLLVNVPSVFMVAWKIIYPFIDCNSKKRIVFVPNKKLTSTLLEDIDESQLPEIYGGKLPLVPIENC